MASKYKAFNGPAPTTAAQAAVATGATIKTMLQLVSTTGLVITGWGYSLDTETATAASKIELVETDVAATVTAFAAGDVTAIGTPSTASLLTLGVAASGYTGSAEGTITATDMFDVVQLPVSTTAGPHMLYSKFFAVDERPYLPVGKFLRVRATMGATNNMICWVSWLEP